MTILEKLKNEISHIAYRLSYLTASETDGEMEERFKFDVSFIDKVNNKYGDVTTNIPLILAKKNGKSPKETGEVILKEINFNIESNKELSKIIKKVELANNGFINFFLKDEFLIEEINKISKIDFIENKFTSKKVLVEHSSPNLFKPFHIGHLMNNIIGESIVQMMKASHADMRTISFPSDISIGIAKAIYILKNKKNWSFFNEDIINILGEAYVEGVKFYEENPQKQNEIKLVAKNLFERNEETEDYQIYKKAKEVNIEYFKNIVKELDSKFDHFIYESEAGIRGEEIVKNNINKKLEDEVFIYGENEAILFDTKKLKNKESNETIKSVFINSEGHPTYEAKDLGLLDLKYSYFLFDYNLFVTDSEQIPHFEVVMQAACELGGILKKSAENSKHIPHGRLNLKGERMSSRLGNVLSVEEVLKKVEEKAKEKMGEKVKDLNEIQKEDLIKKVSLSALRIAILKSKPGLSIDFDFEKSLNFEGATGPYLLYTYARANSLLEKVKEMKIEINGDEIEINEENRNLILNLIQMPNNLKDSIENLQPQTIVKYLFELAQNFNTWYAKEKIINENNQEKTIKNIILVKYFLKIFKFTLNSIGIEEVDKM